MLLSIIVPFYNAEKYLKECLESLARIKLEDIEFICVDDGSKDESKAIAESFKEKDSRFVVLHKENTGYGDTMNYGLKKARGDYVGFLESDDQFVDGSVEKLLSAAFDNDADLVKGNYYIYKENEEPVLFENFKEFPYEVCINSSEYWKLFLTGPAIWSAIYNRKFLLEKKISFLPTPGASYQDTSFAFKIWASAKNVFLIQDPIVFYREDNFDSSSNTTKKVFDIFKETKEMDRYLMENNLEDFSAVCMVAKMHSYKWNMDRLNQDDKIRFITRMHEDAKGDCISGLFQRKYWNDYDWMIMNNVLFNLSGYCDAIREGREPRFRNEVIYDSLKNTPLYIISSSREGEVMLAELWNYGMDICGYINHELIGGMVSISAPVVELKDIDPESMVLISTLEPQAEQLVNILIENNIPNYAVI